MSLCHKLFKMYDIPSIKEVVMEFDGKKYYIGKIGYYMRDERKNGKRKTMLLHRIIWEKEFGPIPKDHHIHHKDENPLNNSLDNLECLPLASHASHHRSREWKSKKLNYLVNAQKKWLSTSKGKLEKSESVRQGWKTRKKVMKTCQRCDKSFSTKSPQAKWCSRSCLFKNWYHKDKK